MIRIGYCPDDTHDWLSKELLPHVFPELPYEFVELLHPGDEAFVDMVLCYRGTSEMIKQR